MYSFVGCLSRMTIDHASSTTEGKISFVVRDYYRNKQQLKWDLKAHTNGEARSSLDMHTNFEKVKGANPTRPTPKMHSSHMNNLN